MHTIAKGLLEYETLTGKEIQDLLDGKPPIRDFGTESGGGNGSAVPTAGEVENKGGEPDTGGMEPQPS